MADEKNLNEEEEMTVTLTLDDDTEVECVVLTIFTAGERDYIALLPMEGEDSEEGEVYLYRYSETEDGTPVLDNIEDDDEYEIVADAFDEMLDDQEYDELVGEDEVEEAPFLKLKFHSNGFKRLSWLNKTAGQSFLLW